MRTGAELLDSIDFYAHVDDGNKATATVEYYKDVEGMAPDAGTSIFQKEVSVKEGKNTYSAGLANQVMDNGSRFSVIVRLSGASFMYMAVRQRERAIFSAMPAGRICIQRRKLCGGNSIYL